MDAARRSEVDAADELRALRERAYGPDADIAADPEALARLDELERGSRVTLTNPVTHVAVLGPGDGTEETLHTESTAAPVAPLSSLPQRDGAPVTSETGSTVPRATVGTRARAAVAWVRGHRSTAIVIAAVLIVALTVPTILANVFAPRPTLTIPGVMTAAGEQPDLQGIFGGSIDRDQEWLRYEYNEDIVLYALEGMEGRRCLVLMVGDGYTVGSCIAAPLRPQVDLFMSADLFGMPGIAGAEIGTSLRFVLDGDILQTWVIPPAAVVATGAVDDALPEARGV